MRLYLSSYKLGNDQGALSSLAPTGGLKVGHIPNALDFTGVDEARRERDSADELRQLESLGFSVQHLDLREYFGRPSDLRDRLSQLGVSVPPSAP